MKRMILIVDDEERVLFVLKKALANLEDGVEVETATTAMEALEKAERASFEIVITDLIMPDMDGIELTEQIKDLMDDPVVVWMTAYGCTQFEREAERLEVACCFEKPLEIQAFREVVKRAMEMPEERGDERTTGGALPSG